MKKIFCFLILTIIANLAAFAQQDPQFTFNRMTQFFVNPGFAGNDGSINGLILNRTQWAGFEGAPTTMLFSVNSPTKVFGLDGGLGLNIISDELGFQKDISVAVDYAYRTKIRFGDLGIGVSLGFYNMGINGEWYNPENEYYGSITDGAVPKGEVSQMAIDVGLGVFLKSNDYSIGLSVKHLNQPEILFQDAATTFLARHYYLSAGYNMTMSDPLFEIQPFILIKTDLAAYQADITVEVVYKKKFSAGLNYRLNDAVSLLLGAEMNNGLKLGYAYDLITSAMAGYSGGSHELFVNYSFDLGKNRIKKYKSVRFL